MGDKEIAVRQRRAAKVRERATQDAAKRKALRDYTEKTYDRLVDEINEERKRVFDLVKSLDWSNQQLATFQVFAPTWWNRRRFVDKELALFILGLLVKFKPGCDWGAANQPAINLAIRSDGKLAIHFTGGTLSLYEWGDYDDNSKSKSQFDRITLSRLEKVIEVLRAYKPPLA